MKQPTTRHYAPPPQPTILGAAIFAAAVSFPVGIVLILMELLLF
ncbi:MAG: hypothetical protein ACI91Z_001256 [Yoonia sp.]|jgi:hypothetical protein